MPLDYLPPPGETALQSSANAAAANNVAITAAAGKTCYVSGFTVTGAGATAASVIEITLAGSTVTLRFKLAIPAGATVGVTPLVVRFNPPLQAAAPEAQILLSVPSFGAGNTAAAATIHGFRI